MKSNLCGGGGGGEREHPLQRRMSVYLTELICDIWFCMALHVSHLLVLKSAINTKLNFIYRLTTITECWMTTRGDNNFFEFLVKYLHSIL